MQLLQQRLAEFLTVGGLIAGRINTALQRRVNIFQRRFKLNTLVGIQRLLILRADTFGGFIKIICPAMNDQFPGTPPVKVVQIIRRQPLLHHLTAEQRQAQYMIAVELIRLAITGAEKLQQPAPLPRRHFQTHIERRVGFTHPFHPLQGNATIGQGGHIPVAKLPAVSKAGCLTWLRLTLQQLHLMTALD